MKSTFTKKGLAVLTVVAVSLANISSAQTVFTVTASGGSFSPNSVTIDQGDTVRFTNAGGTHNINGTIATYPNNPESFGNGAASSTLWTYDFVFTIIGTYDYRCDIHGPGGTGMVGTVIVNDTTIVADIANYSVGTDNPISKIYPIPASDHVVIELSPEFLTANVNLVIVVYDLMGKEIIRHNNIKEAIISFDTESWSDNVYTFQLLSDSELIETGKIIIQ